MTTPRGWERHDNFIAWWYSRRWPRALWVIQIPMQDAIGWVAMRLLRVIP